MLSISTQQLGGAGWTIAQALAPLGSSVCRAIFAGATHGLKTSTFRPGQALPSSHGMPAAVTMSWSEVQPREGLVIPDVADCRTAFPEAIWSKVAELLPLHRRQQPIAVDLCSSTESRAALELAQRGFNVLSVCARGLTPTYLHPEGDSSGTVDVVSTALLEPGVVRDGAADLVTVMGGLQHAQAEAARPALLEAHRILRPGGRLVVAANDLDLRHHFGDMLAEVTEFHSGRSCSASQHVPHAFAPLLRQNGLFRVVGYFVESNPTRLSSPAALAAALAAALSSQPATAQALNDGAVREAYCDDVSALAEWGFGAGPVLLPLVARMYVLEKMTARNLQ